MKKHSLLLALGIILTLLTWPAAPTVAQSNFFLTSVYNQAMPGVPIFGTPGYSNSDFGNGYLIACNVSEIDPVQTIRVNHARGTEDLTCGRSGSGGSLIVMGAIEIIPFYQPAQIAYVEIYRIDAAANCIVAPFTTQRNFTVLSGTVETVHALLPGDADCRPECANFEPAGQHLWTRICRAVQRAGHHQP
jgi:hypothetical protein